MVGFEVGTGQAVAGDESAAGPQDAEDLGQELVLERGRRDVVQHGERRRAAEATVGEVERGRVADDDLDRVVGREPFDEHGGQFLVDLDRSQLRQRLAQHVGGGAVSGADLEDVVAQVHIAQ